MKNGRINKEWKEKDEEYDEKKKSSRFPLKRTCKKRQFGDRKKARKTNDSSYKVITLTHPSVHTTHMGNIKAGGDNVDDHQPEL